MSAEARPQGPTARGRLRIYLGYAPRCRHHLRAAQRGPPARGARHRRGGDERGNAGRPHTEDLLAGLEVIPSAKVSYRGTLAEEMDLGVVLARGPAGPARPRPHLPGRPGGGGAGRLVPDGEPVGAARAGPAVAGRRPAAAPSRWRRSRQRSGPGAGGGRAQRWPRGRDADPPGGPDRRPVRRATCWRCTPTANSVRPRHVNPPEKEANDDPAERPLARPHATSGTMGPRRAA